MQTIAVIDYGMGNLRSVAKAIETVAPQHHVVVTSNADTIASADRVVCPGQGAAADCMQAIASAGLTQTIQQLIGHKPFLGICMGLQVLLTRSEENNGIDCMNVVPGQVKRFNNPLFDSAAPQSRLKVPHMGWSQVSQSSTHAMWHNIANQARFYFAHSYYCVPDNASCVYGTCHYGDEFAVALAGKNWIACQFHPEKSAADGLQLLKNFINWDGET